MESNYTAALSTIAQVVAGFAAIAFAVVLVRLSTIEQALGRLMDQLADPGFFPKLGGYTGTADYQEFAEGLKSPNPNSSGMERLVESFMHEKKRREALIFELNLSLGMSLLVVILCIVGLTFGVSGGFYMGLIGGLTLVEFVGFGRLVRTALKA